MTATRPGTLTTPTRERVRRTPGRQLAVVAGAVAAPLLIHVGAVAAGRAPAAPLGTSGTAAGLLPFGSTVVVATVAAVLGWAALAVLAHLAERGRSLWALLAVVVLLVSFVPLLVLGADPGDATVLAAMHMAVAAVLVPGLLAFGPRPRRATFARRSSRASRATSTLR